MPTPEVFEGMNPRGTQTFIPCKDAKAQNGVIANTKLIKDTVGWSGKNKLPNNASTHTNNGVTFTVNADGSITANGTATNDASNGWNIGKIKAGKYILSGCPANGSNSTYYIRIGTTDSASDTWGSYLAEETGNGRLITLEADTYLTINVRVMNGQTINNLIFYPMLRDANILDSTYEPYFGSTAFPRSEQAVLGAKNLAYCNQPSDTVKTVVCTVGADKSSVTLNGSPDAGNMAFPFYIGTFPKGSYKLSGGDFTAHGVRVHIRWLDSSAGLDAISTDGDASFTITNDSKNVVIYVYLNSGFTADNFVVKPMIRLSTDPDSTWAPHAMTNKELTDAKLGVVKDLSSSNDLDSITDLGFYTLTSSPTHAPEGASYCSMMVIPFSTLASNGRMQIIFKEERMYHRKLSGSPLTWSSWSKFTGTTI